MDFKGAKNYILTRLEKELKPNLYYHGIHHTLDVYDASIRIAELENLSQEEKVVINTAALYHDAGFIYQYEDNEEVAVKLTESILPKFGYNEKQIKTIGEVILTTKIKTQPRNLLEEIMCDADYDYLGRNDVYEIAETLSKELSEYDENFHPEAWNEMQIQFLSKHQYYTQSAIILRAPKKQEYLDYIKSLK
jgi:predicted metal-dependent HD superfamily phosphohydrolase